MVKILTMPGEKDIVAGVIQLANLLTRRAAPVFEKANITPQQWSILSLLSIAKAPTTLAALARRLGVTKQNMTGMISRLEQLGLVGRAEDPNDLRSWRVQITRRGRSMVERVTPMYEEWRASLGSEMSDREVQTFVRTVNRLIEQLERQ